MNTQTSLVAEQVRLQQWAEQIKYSCAMKSHFRKSAPDYSIDKVYKQQKYMYEHKVHSVPDRIVSISQPYIRPIVRGKAAAPVEFGARIDLSLDEKGMARIERMSFDAYNESDVLIEAVKRYFERTGHYPERILADKIYRNRNNLAYCRAHGIRLSGPSLGRPKKMQGPTKRRNTRIMLTGLPWKELSPWQSKNTGSV